MKKILLFIVLTVAVAFVFYSFTSDDQPKGTAKKSSHLGERPLKSDVKDTPDIVRKAGEMQRESYMKRAEESLEDMEGRLEHLKAEAKKAGKKAREKMEEALEELDEGLKGTREKLAELKKASGEAWDRMKEKMDEAFQDLEKKYKTMISRKD